MIVVIVVAVIVIHAIAVIVVFTRPQRFKPPLKVRGKSRAEFTNVLKSFQTALRQVLLSFLLIPSALNLLKKCVGNPAHNLRMF